MCDIEFISLNPHECQSVPQTLEYSREEFMLMKKQLRIFLNKNTVRHAPFARRRLDYSVNRSNGDRPTIAFIKILRTFSDAKRPESRKINLWTNWRRG
jgi:hypothetical protein